MRPNVSVSGNPGHTESFSDEQLNELIVTLVQGTNLFGDPIYSYVELPLGKFIEMARKIRDGEKFKASDFGTVLAAGRGDPEPELKQEMSDTYKLMDVPQPPKPASPLAEAKPVPAYTPPKFFDDQD